MTIESLIHNDFPIGKKYGIIYADPPWSFYNDSDSIPNKTSRVGVRKPPYAVMSSENIAKLPVVYRYRDHSH